MALKDPQFIFDFGKLLPFGRTFKAAWPLPRSKGLARGGPNVGYLTVREGVVLAEIIRGHSNKEIARSLDISPRTVEFHRANLLKKYGAKNTADLLRRVLG